MAVVLGIDPGFAAVGWAVVDLQANGEELVAMGVIQTKKFNQKQTILATEDNFIRARYIHRELAALVSTYQIRAFACEAMSFPRHASNAAKIAMCWGVIAAISEYSRLPIVQASPQRVKKNTVGMTTASKEEIIEHVSSKFPEATTRFIAASNKGMHEHAFDAVAVVLACLDSEVFRMARGQ